MDCGGGSDLGPGSPIDAQSREARSTPVVSQRVQEAVRRHVISLAGRTEEGSRRRVEDEEIERQPEGQSVQIPCSQDFRAQDTVETFPGLLLQNAVVEESGGVEDAAQLWHRFRDGLQHAGHLWRICNVGLRYYDLCPGALHRVDGFTRRFGRSAASRE